MTFTERVMLPSMPLMITTLAGGVVDRGKTDCLNTHRARSDQRWQIRGELLTKAHISIYSIVGLLDPFFDGVSGQFNQIDNYCYSRGRGVTISDARPQIRATGIPSPALPHRQFRGDGDLPTLRAWQGELLLARESLSIARRRCGFPVLA